MTVPLQQSKGMQSSKRGMWKGYHLSIEGIQKDSFFVKKWHILKGKGLDLMTRIKFFIVPPPPPQAPFFILGILYWAKAVILYHKIYWIGIHLRFPPTQRSSYGVGVRLATVKRLCSFIISAMFCGYSNPLLVHLQLKHWGNVFFFRLGWKKRLLSKGDVVLRLG